MPHRLVARDFALPRTVDKAAVGAAAARRMAATPATGFRRRARDATLG